MKDTPTTSLDPYQHLHSQIISLTERLLTLVEGLRSPPLSGEMKHVRSQIHSITIKILVAGELNAGKSTIINALLEAKVLPAYPVPTTALVTAVKRGKQTKVILHPYLSSDGTQPPPRNVALTEMESYLMFDRNRKHTHNFEKVEVFLPLSPAYNGIEFIDPVSPYDDDGYEKALERSVPSADVILYASGCDTLPSKEEALVIDWIRSASHDTLFFLCNRFDLVKPQSQKMVKRRYFTHLSQRTDHRECPVFFTSAKLALDGYLRDDMRQVAQSNMPLVKEALDSFIARRGSQKLQPVIALLDYAIHLSLEVVSARKKLQHSVRQTRLNSRAKLLSKCKLLAEKKLHMNDVLNAIRQEIGKEVETAAGDFYIECSYILDSHIQSYIPQRAYSTWEVFSGDAPERLAKSMITVLTETIREQFQAWVASTLEPLLHERINPIGEVLAEDTVTQIVQSVENRINFTWHSAPLIKRIFENASLDFHPEPEMDLQQMKTYLVQVYRHELEESTRQLVAAITDTIDNELRQRQEELVHLLDLELQCLSDVVRTSVEDEQAQEHPSNNATGHLLSALEENLYTIEHELSDLKKTMPMKNTMLKETNNEHQDAANN